MIYTAELVRRESIHSEAFKSFHILEIPCTCLRTDGNIVLNSSRGGFINPTFEEPAASGVKWGGQVALFG